MTKAKCCDWVNAGVSTTIVARDFQSRSALLKFFFVESGATTKKA